MAFNWSMLANPLQDLGYGLTQGNNVSSALKAAGQRTADMAQPRAQAEIMQRQEQERQFAIQQQSAQRNQTVKWLMQNNMPDLAEAFSMGMIDGNGLFAEIKARKTPAQPTFQKLSPGETLLEQGPNGPRPVYTAPTEPKLQSGMMMGADGKPVLDPTSNEAFDRESKLASQYSSDPTVKNYTVIRDNFEKVQSASQMQTGAGDISLVFGFMKMLDPGSVVREQEYANASNAAGVPERIVSIYNKLLDGQFLSPDQRKEFVAAAQKVYADAASNLEDVNAQVSKRAGKWGVDSSAFIMTPEQFAASVNGGAPTPVPGMNGVTITKVR